MSRPDDAAPCWVLVAPPPNPETEQGRPELYLNTDEGDGSWAWEWDEEPCMATGFTDAEKAAFDLSVFDGAVEWRQRSG